MRYSKPIAESNPFTLDPRLAHDTLRLGALDLCDVLLFDDSRYDWVILVPRVADCVEFLDLDAQQQKQLATEVKYISGRLKQRQPSAKLNIGALGNVVSQLHVHILLRHPDDPAWPGPVWGHSPAQRHSNDSAAQRLADFREFFFTN